MEAVGYGSVLKLSVGSVGKPLGGISSAPVKKFIIVLSVTVSVVRKLSQQLYETTLYELF